MRKLVFALSLAAITLAGSACSDQTSPGAKGRQLGVAHVPSRSVGTTASGATLTTDQDDYSPGQPLKLTGAGWPAGDVVSIHLDEAPQNHPAVDWTVTADASGAFTDATYVVQTSDAGVTFTITATSGSTGDVATASFTDTPNGLGSLCANVAGFGDAICPTANGATGVLSPSHYKQKVGTSATYQIVGATDAATTGACAPDVAINVRNTNGTIDVNLCGTLAGSTITFSVTLPSDKCGTAAVTYNTHVAPFNANNDIIFDGVKNGNATTLGGIAPTDAAGNVIVPIQGVCPVQPPTLPSANCVAIVAVQGFPIAPVTMVGTGGSGGPYTFSAVGLPAGLNMASDGTISGTPTVGGTFSYTVTVTDNGGHSGTFNCSVTVYAAPTTSCVSITAVQGFPITPVTMVGAGGTGGPYTFAATGLPAGLNMASNGTISGTPSVSGTFSYTVTVTDNTGHTGTFDCSVTVGGAPTASCVAITAVQGFAITPVTMVGSGGTGGPYTFSATGLPSGLTMASNGTISGTPSVSGTFSYTVTVTDNTGHTGTINCSVTVNAPPTASCVAITAVQGFAITPVTMTGSGGTGGPYTFSATGLPSGLTMASNGTISGTPTVSGTFSYTVTVTDNTGHTGTVNCSVTVNPPPTATCVVISAVQGNPITPVTMTGSGGTGGPYTFSAVGLPAGLTMSAGGTISGTPTVNGTFNYTVTVKDKDGHTGTVNCTVVVYVPPTASCVAITAVQGSPITPVTLAGSGGAGGPYTYSATGLPTGLSMSAGGTISGTPSVNGTFTYTVTIKDKNGNVGSFNCTVVVAPPPTANCVTITAWKGALITPVTLTGSGGAGGPYTFSAVGLPAGLSISTSGTISGTPTVSGTFSYTVTVTDKNGNKGTFNCSVTVNSDGTPPVCSVYEQANPPYMSYQDGGSGIMRMDIVTNLNSNFKVTVSPTPVGTTFSPAVPSQPYAMPTGTVIMFPQGTTGLIKVSATRINTSKSAQLTVKATDWAGHTVTCDPVMTTLTKLKQDDGDQTYTGIPYADHFVRIENGGLKSMDVIVNGTTFKVKRLDDTEVRVVDVSSAMKHNNNNTITLSPSGKKGETADVTIGATATP